MDRKTVLRSDGPITKGAAPFLVVEIKLCMMIWSTPVHCKGVDDLVTIKETVASPNSLGSQS